MNNNRIFGQFISGDTQSAEVVRQNLSSAAAVSCPASLTLDAEHNSAVGGAAKRHPRQFALR